MENIKPLVSIIVPNYNHERFLKQRLESVINQTYSNIEVVLLDDCSTDNSRAILLEYAHNLKVSHCIFNDMNSGNTFVQWNKGIQLAKGEFVWIAESDDFCELHFLEELIQPFLEDGEVALSYCQSNRVDEKGLVIGNWKTHTDNLDSDLFSEDFVLDGNLFIEKYLIYKNVIPNASAVLFRKENLKISDQLNIDPALKYCGDWVIYFQVIIKQKVSFIADSINNFRSHDKSVIAVALKSEKKVSLIDIDLQMRKVMEDCLYLDTPSNANRILENNKTIIKALKYDKALILFNNHQKWKAIFILLRIIDEFVKRYPFRKRFTQLINFF